MKSPTLPMLVLVTTLYSCQQTATPPDNSASPSATTTGVVREVVGKELQNRTCVPGIQVGPIIASSTEADIVRIFGEKNVVRQELREQQEDIEPQSVSIVFEDKPDQLLIRWATGLAYKQIASVYISGDGATWRTPEGIGIGSTLDDLVRTNGRDFDFYGLEWDNSGMSSSWKGGQINKNLIVYLVANNPDAIFAKGGPIGDKIYSSSLPLSKEAKLEVGGILIKF